MAPRTPATSTKTPLLSRLVKTSKEGRDLAILQSIVAGVGKISSTGLVTSAFATPNLAYRNRSARRQGVYLEVTRAGPVGARALVSGCAPLPVDTVGGQTPVVVLLPNEGLTLQLTSTQVEIMLHVIDPGAALKALD